MKQIITKIKAKLDLEKPYALSWDDWDDWHAKTKKERPMTYFVMETVPKVYGKITYNLGRPYTALRVFVRSRITQRWHIVKTGLPADYHEISTRMLHANFNLLVDFVEVEKAWMQVIWDKDEPLRKKFPWWSLNPTRFSSYRSPEAGLKYLAWEASLVKDEAYTKNKRDFGKPTEQALAAKETAALYDWWKNVRPKRPDPHDVSGWTELCDERRANGHNIFSERDETADYKRRVKIALNKLRKIEADVLKEDEDMLIRLIRLRESLWT